VGLRVGQDGSGAEKTPGRLPLPSRYSNNSTGAFPKAEYVHVKSASWEAANFPPPSPQLPIVRATNVTRTSERCLQFHETLHGRIFTKNRLILYFFLSISKQKADIHCCFIYLLLSLLLFPVFRLCGHIMFLQPRCGSAAGQKNVLMRASM